MKSKRLFIIFGMLFSCVLSGCGKAEASICDAGFISLSTASYSADCEYQVSANDGRLCFWDIEKNVETVICSSPNCTHELYSENNNPDPKCTAVEPHGDVFGNVFIYGDKLYYFTTSGLNQSKLWRCDKNGENKKQICDFDAESVQLTAPYLDKNRLVFVMQKAVFDDTDSAIIAPEEYIYSLCLFDLDTEKLTEISTFDKPKQFMIRNLSLHDNTLIYELFQSDVSFTELYDFSSGTYIDEPINHDSCKVIKLDISSGAEEILFDSPTTRLIGCIGDKLYISKKSAEDYSLPDEKIVEYSLDNGAENDVLIRDGDYYSASVFDGYIVFNDSFDINVLNLKSGEINTVPQTEFDIYSFCYATKKYAVLESNGLTEKYARIPLDDFVSGDISDMAVIEFEDLNAVG